MLAHEPAIETVSALDKHNNATIQSLCAILIAHALSKG
jgi:hypothetical protein